MGNTTHQTTYFDVRIFNPFAQSYGNSSMSKCHRKDELDKKREYEEQIRGLMFTFGILYSWGYGPNSNHSVQENSIINYRQATRTLFYHTFFWLQCKHVFFFTLLSDHVLSRKQVFSFPLRIPIYTIDLCRGKGSLKVVLIFLHCLICILYLFF